MDFVHANEMHSWRIGEAAVAEENVMSSYGKPPEPRRTHFLRRLRDYDIRRSRHRLPTQKD